MRKQNKLNTLVLKNVKQYIVTPISRHASIAPKDDTDYHSLLYYS